MTAQSSTGRSERPPAGDEVGGATTGPQRLVRSGAGTAERDRALTAPRGCTRSGGEAVDDAIQPGSARVDGCRSARATCSRRCATRGFPLSGPRCGTARSSWPNSRPPGTCPSGGASGSSPEATASGAAPTAPRSVTPRARLVEAVPASATGEALVRQPGRRRLRGRGRRTTHRHRLAFFGVRPCDLRAIQIQDQVLGSGHGNSRYGARRAAVLIVAVNCTEPGETCFCASMGTGPGAGPGYDLALTELVAGERHSFPGGCRHAGWRGGAGERAAAPGRRRRGRWCAGRGRRGGAADGPLHARGRPARADGGQPRRRALGGRRIHGA